MTTFNRFPDKRNISENDFKASSVEIYDADTRANIDLQVSTAKKYRRDLNSVMNNILAFSCRNIEIAQDCFYSIVKDGKIIRGLSIRFAELLASCYGNLRASSKVISNDGKIITAQGIAWDLENNVAYSIEVKQSVINEMGKPYTDDIQLMISNKACSIALRNALFKCIPDALTNEIQDEIKVYALGDNNEFVLSKTQTIDFFTSKGVSISDVCRLFDKKDIQELTREDIFDLIGLKNSIKNNETTINSIFTINIKPNVLSKATNKLQIPDSFNNVIENIEMPNTFDVQENLDMDMDFFNNLKDKKNKKNKKEDNG